MDYEKKYKEALERANKQRADYQKELDKTDKNSQLAGLLRAGISAIDMAFPELAESEDERIRKALVIMIKVPRKEIFEAQGITKEQALAYLEKQKEPIDPFDTKLFQDGVKEGRRLEREDIMRKEQKPEENDGKELLYVCNKSYKIGYRDGKRDAEQKPAGWSEEDEKIMQTLLDYYEKALDNYTCVEWLNGITYRELCDWLKSLRPAKDCSSCAKHLEGYISGRSDAENKLLEQFGALITPEGELVIPPRWKPSKEQMEALSDAYVEASTFKKGDILESLYNDLKKL